MSRSVRDRLPQLGVTRATSRDAASRRPVEVHADEGVDTCRRRLHGTLARLREPAPPSLRARVQRELRSAAGR